MDGARWRYEHGIKVVITLASVPDRVADHVRARAEFLALDDGKTQLTYGELGRLSDVIGSHLQDSGVGPEHCVGLFLERSVEFVVAALAVMKSGAAYLPLDRSTPPARVAAIMADAGASILLADRGAQERIGGGPLQVIDIETASGSESTHLVSVDITHQSLAYIIYTSGSTGEPKGVEITHANLTNLIEWHLSAFDVTSADRASQVASLSFDAAVWEIWPYLTAGASVHIADELTRRSWEALRDWFVAREITIGFVPTALAERLVATAWPADADLRLLLTGGDMLRRRPIAGLPFTLVNNYGPTECTVVTTSGVVQPGEQDAPSIGSPITGARALILDEADRPVAVGDIGELCVAGALVGRGYRNRPELTASRFVEHIQPASEEIRIYRTGDRVRQLSNGEIVFVGRSDDQVKIRGYRIELGEITAWLHRVPGVRSCLVTVQEIGESGPSLVAYVVAEPEARLTATEIQSFLSDHLPDHMVPAFFVSLAALPVLPNGKPDRSALPSPSEDNLLSSSGAVASTLKTDGNVEGQLSELVATMLGRPSIGRNDDFFLMGGHSMLGIELTGRIRDMFGVRLTLRQLFASPTVADLAAQVAHLME